MPPPRDPELTRQHIIDVAAEEMRVNGYKAAGLADILEKAGVSKGALYHHFASKQDLGYAVYEEVFIREFLQDWDLPLSSDEPIDALCEWLLTCAATATEEALSMGCPVCNIAVEMSGLDEGIRTRTVAMFEQLQSRISDALETAQQRGQVRSEVEVGPVSAFILAALQGAFANGKYGGDIETFKSIVKCLANYVASLKR